MADAIDRILAMGELQGALPAVFVGGVKDGELFVVDCPPPERYQIVVSQLQKLTSPQMYSTVRYEFELDRAPDGRPTASGDGQLRYVYRGKAAALDA